MKIYTKTGDEGTTCIIGGDRFEKCIPLMEVIGDLDELVGHLGLCNLEYIQPDIMTINAMIAGSKKVKINEVEVLCLERCIDLINAKVPELTSFIMPTGVVQSNLFIARAVCRRAERHFVSLDNKDEYPHVLKYLNRLSDLLFMLAYESNTNAKHWP